MISSMDQQSGDYCASIAPHTPFNDYLSKPFNFLDLNNKMESTESHASIKCSKMPLENWYQNGIKSGRSDHSSSISGDDTDSNGSSQKMNHNTVNSANGDEEKAIQEHHARRPMNAFLIFCKRHRNIVRERYSNLENRAITKILGDWWALLSEAEKSCYSNLAKEYKDAFFNANPDFKWYKLPAPPLRSVSYNRSNSGNDSSDCDTTFNRTTGRGGGGGGGGHKLEKCSPDVGTFKLADEAHMGGLNSLMVAADIVRSITNNNYKFNADQSTEDEEADCGQSYKNELHRILGETGTFLQKTMDDFSDQSDVFAFDVASANTKNIPQNSNRSKTSSSSDFDSIDDDMNGVAKASPRACKGKRYMEFMNAQRATAITKRIKPRTTSISSSVSLSPTQPLRSFGKNPVSINGTAQKMDFETFDHLYANQNVPNSSKLSCVPAKLCANMDRSLASPPNNQQHRGDVGDFDLEQKINALPAHSLDEYLSRKQNTKKKKKGQHDKRSTNGHRKANKITKSKVKTTVVSSSALAPKTIQAAKECLAKVGSQKRKARKESITRRDVQQVTAIVQRYTSPASNSFIIDLPDPIATRCGGASGLLMLATMAEVTANYAV